MVEVSSTVVWYTTTWPHSLSQAGDKRFMAIVERVNGTIKNMIWRYLEANRTEKWVDVLQSLIDNYNSRPHSTLSAALGQPKAPNDITPAEEQQVIYQNKVYNMNNGLQTTLATG